MDDYLVWYSKNISIFVVQGIWLRTLDSTLNLETRNMNDRTLWLNKLTGKQELKSSNEMKLKRTLKI